MMPPAPASSGAEAEHGGEELRHRDADRARHLHVVDAGADHRAEARALHQEVEPDRDHDRDPDHHQPVGRKREAGDAERLLQVRRGRDRDRVAAPDDQAEVGDDERDAERDQHLAEHVAGELAQDEALDEPAERRDDEAAQERREPEVGHDLEDARAEIGAEHEQRAVRQIRDPHQPEDQREARRQQEQQPAEGEAVQRLDGPELHRWTRVIPAPSPRRTGIRGGIQAGVARTPALAGVTDQGSRFFAGGKSREYTGFVRNAFGS